ncbi:MAG: hypothetical protein ACKO5M_02325 [Vulcanococcus sp.]
MADGDFQTSQQSGQNDRFRGERGPREGGGRGPREGGNREQGGFRIRLSDNEMRAARAVQEAFGLRSTVAALGLSIRTVAQLLEEGKLDEVLAQHRAAGGNRPPRERRDGGREGGRGERMDRGERGSGNRPNPFARPARPAAPAAVNESSEADLAAAQEAEELISTEATAIDASSSEGAAEAQVEAPGSDADV